MNRAESCSNILNGITTGKTAKLDLQPFAFEKRQTEGLRGRGVRRGICRFAGQALLAHLLPVIPAFTSPSVAKDDHSRQGRILFGGSAHFSVTIIGILY